MTFQLLNSLDEKKLPESIGTKASNLRVLKSLGVKIPVSHVIPWEAYDRFTENDGEIFQELHAEIINKLDLTKRYAIRSSANVEDNLTHSFAGQFKTRLNVQGLDEILDAVQSIWESTNSPAIQNYLEQILQVNKKLKMGVIIQEMVTPRYSGVVFSRNPITGTDEIVIEVVEGTGEKLVQSGQTPYRWIYKWGKWIVKPEENIMPEEMLTQVVVGTKRIVKKYKKPVDLEWVYDDRTVNWVQLRDITTHQELNIYSNRISKEMMPGQIKPLIWSINVPLIVSVWIELLQEMVGEVQFKVDDFARQFHYRSYFNMSSMGHIFNMAGFPSEGLEMMMGVVPKETGKPVFKMNLGMLRIGPRLFHFLISKWNFSKKYKKEMPLLIKNSELLFANKNPPSDLNDLISQIHELFHYVQKVVYYNINVPLILSMYTNLFTHFLKKKGLQQQFDITHDIKGLEQYSPITYLKQLNKHFRSLNTADQLRIRNSKYDEFLQLDGVDDFMLGVETFLQKFGHLSDNNNNFSAVPWREKPEKILQMIVDYPAEDLVRKPENISKQFEKSLILKILYRRTRQFTLFRDQTSNLYTYSYGLFRVYFLAIAQAFVKNNLLDEADDIFYLNWTEIQTIVKEGSHQNDLKNTIQQRKTAIENTKDIELPTVIFGDTPPPIIPQNSSIIKGVPTSSGYFTGPVCKVLGIDDFPKVTQGNILVIPYSEVGWTPLFTKAGGVISESGGMLSHSSIIAREYGIPAVVSVAGAMKLTDHQIVSIDGYKGEIIIHE